MPQVETAAPLLTSKLHRPRLSRHHIPRLRLVDQLSQYGDYPFVLICAPAGSGKTTLLSEWLAVTSNPTAWVSLDEGDDDVITFTSYVVAAMQARFPTTHFETRNLLRAPALPPLDVLAAALNNDLDQIDVDFHLVLDDYHLITKPAVHALLAQLLRHPPRRLHLVIATRDEPPWPLVGFRARGQVFELRFSDLEFSVDESAAFLRNALGADVAEDLVARLHEESEGWVAGLHLMALAAKQGSGLPRVWDDLGSSEDTRAYLFGEVLNQLSPLVRKRLQQLSILRRFSASLCDAVCDQDGTVNEQESWGKSFIRDLEQRNLFVIALDVRREFFRFHHVFQRFLADRLRERAAPEHIAALHRRASHWFATHGLIEEALDHALAAGDAMTAADLVARHRHDLYNREQFGRLTRWLRRLPIEVKQRSPELLLAEARIATLNWRFTEAGVLLDRAAAALAETTLDQGRAGVAAGELAVLRSILDLWTGNAERLVSDLPPALLMLPLDASHLRGLAHLGMAAGYWQRGERIRAWEYLDQQVADTSPQLPIYATLLQAQGLLHWLDGDMPELLVLAKRLLVVSEELDLPDQKAMAHYFRGIAHFTRQELEPARQELEAAIAARFSMSLLWWCQAVGVLAKTYEALGQHLEARQTLADGRDFLLERHALRALPNLGAFQAALDLKQGRLAEASAWAAQVEPGPLSWSLGAIEPRLVQVRIFLAQEGVANLDRAAALVAEMRVFCQQVPNRRLLMQVEASAVLIEARRGEREGALDKLQDLVMDAEPEGMVRLFVDLGEPMADLLRELAGRRVAPHTIAHILDAFSRREDLPVTIHQDGLPEPLSERELEILGLLTARDSNKEIAAVLYIAPSTVKRHTLNIYRKLEVNNRRSAVSRAAELGLISAEALTA